MTGSEQHDGRMNRRSFLARSTAGALGAAMGARARAQGQVRSRVVVARDEQAVSGDQVDADRVAAMLSKAMAALFGKPASDAWKGLFTVEDTVGIKSTVMMNPVHPELLFAIHAALTEHVGIEDARVRVWDRNRGGVGRAELATMPRSLSYHDDYIVDMVHESTALINCPSLKRHWLAGIGGAVKNWCGAVRGINPMDNGEAVFKFHGDSCAQMGMLNALPPIRERCRLIVIDALTPCHGPGPQVNPADLWAYGGLIVSTDPVAADVVGAQILEAKLEEINGRPTPLTPPTRHLQVADAEYGLGCSDAAAIEVVRV